MFMKNKITLIDVCVCSSVKHPVLPFKMADGALYTFPFLFFLFLLLLLLLSNNNNNGSSNNNNKTNINNNML